MKTHANVKSVPNSSIQTKAKNQVNEGSILQAYKKGTAQLESLEDEEPLQGKFETAQLESMEDEESLQGKFETAQLESLDDEEPLQGKFETAQLEGLEDEEPSQPKENKTGLPDNLKSGVENLSGQSMDDVKVHYNSSQPGALQAHAYAQGTDIHVAPGQEKHLPHEAWHVVQQKEGRVQPTKQLKGSTNINDDAGLENEADVMGAKAMQLKSNVVQLAKFIGAEDAIHIHAEGRNYHVKNSLTNDRYDFDPQDADQVREAYKYMRKNLCGPGISRGARACGKWFRDHQ